MIRKISFTEMLECFAMRCMCLLNYWQLIRVLCGVCINVMTVASLMTMRIKKYFEELKEDIAQPTGDQMELF